MQKLRRSKCDKLLTMLSCLPLGVSSLVIPAAMALTACMPPNQAHFDEPYVSAPADHAVYWHDYQTTTGTQQSAISSRPPEDNLIDTKITYDLPALVDLALHANPETRVSWEEAKAAAARLERNRSAWYPTLTAMAFGQYFKTSFPIPGGALVSTGYSSFGSLDLAWTLFDFGRREALVDAGAQRLTAANFAFNRKHQEIAYRVATSFFAYQAALA